jgi:hypothetical protein
VYDRRTQHGHHQQARENGGGQCAKNSIPAARWEHRRPAPSGLTAGVFDRHPAGMVEYGAAHRFAGSALVLQPGLEAPFHIIVTVARWRLIHAYSLSSSRSFDRA